MTSPFDGLLLWIWNLPNCDGGDPARIVARLQSVGASGAIIKAVDGNRGYNDWDQVKAVIGALRAAGLSACIWGYAYGTPGTAEGAAAVQAVATLGPDAYVFDVEQEFEDQPNGAAQAASIANAMNIAYPSLPWAYSPLPSIRNHLKLPYYQFTSAGWPMLPQLYWTGLGWTPERVVSEFYADAAQYGLTAQPIFPAYQDSAGARPQGDELTRFLSFVKAQGATGVSVWSWEHLDAAGWLRVQEAAQAFPAPQPADPCAAQIAQLEQQLAEALALAARNHAALSQIQSIATGVLA